MLSLFSAAKTFSDPWIGHRRWNERHRLHARRMHLAERTAEARRLAARLAGARSRGCDALDRDGFAVVPDFLPHETFRAVLAEVETAMDAARIAHPIRENHQAGFGAKQPFPGGLDRWDGGTLNRFLTLDRNTMPVTSAAVRLPALSALTRRIVGLPHAAAKTQVYLTVSGDEAANHDIQRDLHRDTFFSAMKFWLFLRPVRAVDGPFVYVPGSHRLTPERLAWEQAEACRIVGRGGRGPNAGGSFRIAADEIGRLGLPDPVSCACEANTLVIANTLGFHARGQAEPGRERLALYGWRRPYPFALLGR